MEVFEGKIIKSDYGLDSSLITWWIKNEDQDIDDGEFCNQILEKIGEGKRVRLTLEEIC